MSNEPFHQRDNGDLVVFIVLVFFGALLLIAMVVDRIHETDRCETKGGTYYCGYKSDCLCLAPGAVLP